MNLARLSIRLAAVGLVAGLSAGCVVDALESGATGSFERTLQVAGPVDLSVRTGSGSIRIQTGAGNSVHIVGQIRARGSSWAGMDAAERVGRIQGNPPIEQNGNSILIGEVYDPFLRQQVSISYEVTVPANTRVESRTGSGDQVIGDVRGSLDAEAGSGKITAGRIGGEVSVSTGSGDIEIVSAGGRLEAKTGSGSIRAAGVAGPVRVRTGSGRIELVQTAPGELDASTGSGGLTIGGAHGPIRVRAGSGDITLAGNPSSDWRVRTGSGKILVDLPSTASFALDAETGSGAIEIAHPLQALGVQSQRRVQATVRNGGPRVELFTSSGRIRVD
jgi:hypothetical protein